MCVCLPTIYHNVKLHFLMMKFVVFWSMFVHLCGLFIIIIFFFPYTSDKLNFGLSEERKNIIIVIIIILLNDNTLRERNKVVFRCCVGINTQKGKSEQRLTRVCVLVFVPFYLRHNKYYYYHFTRYYFTQKNLKVLYN